jgi:hypothetical protein
VGDSHTWGSGLTDAETIPWTLAEQLKVPVFNGGRTPDTLFQVLNNPKVKNSTLIIELVAEHLVDKTLFRDDFVPSPHYSGKKSYMSLFDIHPKRYFLPLKILRYLNPFNIYNELSKKNLDNMMVNQKRLSSLNLSEEDLTQAVANIQKRADRLKQMGYTYVFGIIPNRAFLLSNNKDPKTQDLQNQRSHLLNSSIHFIDLHKVFTEWANPQELYFPSDSHVNTKGAFLIGTSLANYVKEAHLYRP